MCDISREIKIILPYRKKCLWFFRFLASLYLSFTTENLNFLILAPAVGSDSAGPYLTPAGLFKSLLNLTLPSKHQKYIFIKIYFGGNKIFSVPIQNILIFFKVTLTKEHLIYNYFVRLSVVSCLIFFLS